MAIPAGGHTRPQLFSGARGQLFVNNTLVGFITDVAVNIQANVRAVHTFGAPNARSVEPLSYGVNVTIGSVVPVNDSQGNPVDSSPISTAFGGVEPVIAQMLIAEDITISLLDGPTNQTVAQVRNCRFSGDTLNLSAQQIASRRITLVGIFDAVNNTDDGIGL